MHTIRSFVPSAITTQIRNSAGAALVGLAMICTAGNAPAAPVTFLGVDLNTGNTVPAGGNADTARTNFLSNLSSVGNENFSGIAVGTQPPLTLSSPGFERQPDC